MAYADQYYSVLERDPENGMVTLERFIQILKSSI